MSKVDLHMHSCVSDGRYAPAELIARAAAAGLQVIALTDHDNVDGIPAALEAAQKFPNLRVIPGVEISTEEPEGEVHVLGYFIDCGNPELLAALEKSRESRVGRAHAMLEKLAGLGMPLEWKRVQQIAGDGTIGRPHIAQALLEKGYIATLKEAFEKYIADGGPAYVERIKITPAETVELISRAGGIAVLAHPLTSKRIRGASGTTALEPKTAKLDEPEATIARLKKNGLAGIEAYYGEYTQEQVQSLLKLAEKYGLLATGGSDYHGLDENAETRLGGAKVPLAAAEKLIARAEQRT